MKFLHTADWQLSIKAAQVGGAGEWVRAEGIKIAERIVRLARDQAVDFIPLAGGTFEDNAVERVLIQQTADLLGNPLGGFYPALLRFKMDQNRIGSCQEKSGADWSGVGPDQASSSPANSTGRQPVT